jgi:hypothetical protein
MQQIEVEKVGAEASISRRFVGFHFGDQEYTVTLASGALVEARMHYDRSLAIYTPAGMARRPCDLAPTRRYQPSYIARSRCFTLAIPRPLSPTLNAHSVVLARSMLPVSCKLSVVVAKRAASAIPSSGRAVPGTLQASLLPTEQRLADLESSLEQVRKQY